MDVDFLKKFVEEGHAECWTPKPAFKSGSDLPSGLFVGSVFGFAQMVGVLLLSFVFIPQKTYIELRNTYPPKKHSFLQKVVSHFVGKKPTHPLAARDEQVTSLKRPRCGGLLRRAVGRNHMAQWVPFSFLFLKICYFGPY